MGALGDHDNEAPEPARESTQQTTPEKLMEDSIKVVDLERGETLDGSEKAADKTDEVDRHDHYVPQPQQQTTRFQWLKDWNIFLFNHGFGIIFSIPMLVPLILIAQKKIFNAGECQARETQCGFQGNEDAYGLGIRLGVYLQWMTHFLITTYLPDEERPLMATMAVFIASLLIAILVLTFGDNCTYSVEIIVMHFIIVPCELLNTLTKTGRGIVEVENPDSDDEEEGEPTPSSAPPRLKRIDSFIVSSDHSRGMHGWTAATAIIDTLSMVYAAWFWIRMSIGTDQAFAPTPCGTSVFFLARVQGPGIPVISAVVSAFIIAIIAYEPLEWTLGKILSKRVRSWCLAPFYILIVVPLVAPGLVTWLIVYGVTSFRRRGQEDAEESPWASQAYAVELICGTLGLGTVVVSIAGIELLLHWNGVSHVYTVSSTGQLIPLCAGLFNFLPIFWKLLRKRFAEEKDDEGSEKRD